MMMPGRKYEPVSGYRYGFNGKEKDKDLSSLTAYDYGFRIYNPAIGKFLSTDPLQEKLPSLNPYNFVANNPVIYVDTDGRILQFYGDAKEFRKTEALINNKFAGSNIKVVIGANGIMTITGDTKKLSSQQLALYNSLNTVISSKGTTNMYALKEKERGSALGGLWSGPQKPGDKEPSIKLSDGTTKNVQAYDVYDMQALDKNKTDGISGVSDLAHEIFEAYMYQDQKVTDYMKAHNAALKVQGDVDGYTNVQNTSVPGSGVMNVTYTTSDGKQMKSDLPYSNNNWSGASTTTDITPIAPTKHEINYKYTFIDMDKQCRDKLGGSRSNSPWGFPKTIVDTNRLGHH